MKFLKLAALCTILTAQNTMAAQLEKKIFTMEKSYNPQNIMVISTSIDDSCKFVSNEGEYLNFYWLMDGKNKKEIHSLIRGQLKEKIKFRGINERHDSFKIKLNDLSELKHDLEDTTMEISSEIQNGNCNVKSILKLGATAKYRKLNLKRLYCEVTTNMLGIPNGCKFIDLEGKDVDSNEKLKVRFYSK